jgi:hypothetical protein
MTVLQQEHRVHGAAKKAIAHQRQDELAQGASTAHLSRVCNQASFSEEMGPVVCPSRESRGGTLLTSRSLRRLTVSLVDYASLQENLFIKAKYVNKNWTI